MVTRGSRVFLFIMLALAFSVSLLAQQPAARIKIDTDRVIGEVDPLLFGNFAEHLGLGVDLTTGTGWPFGGPSAKWPDHVGGKFL